MILTWKLDQYQILKKKWQFQCHAHHYAGLSLLRRWASSTNRKFVYPHSLNFYTPPKVRTKIIIFKLYPNKNFIFSCSLWYLLISSSWFTQIMLILILTEDQYLHNVVFTLKKVPMVKTLLLADSNHSTKSPPKIYPLTLFWKPCHVMPCLL